MEMEVKETHKCKCNSDMEYITHGDWDNGTFWCKVCGTLLVITIDEEEKWYEIKK